MDVANCSEYKRVDIFEPKAYLKTSTAAAPLPSKRNSLAFVFLRAKKKLAFSPAISHKKINNTSHASRKICAPWEVTFFGGNG